MEVIDRFIGLTSVLVRTCAQQIPCSQVSFVACRFRCGACNPVDFQQRQGQVTHLDQHPVQRRLIGEGTAKPRVVIAIVGDGQSGEPLRPVLVKAPLDAPPAEAHLLQASGGGERSRLATRESSAPPRC